MQAAGPIGDELPDERTVDSYHEGQVRLTTRRVVYKGRGMRRYESWSVQLDDITAVGIRRRPMFHAPLLAIPLGILALGFMGSMATGDDDPFFGSLLLAMATAPAPFLRMGMELRVAAPGDLLQVPVPRKRLAAAQQLVQRIEAMRAERHGPEAVPVAYAPTAQPFSR